MNSGRGSDPGLLDALRQLSGTALGMAQSRLELASLELGEARDRLLTTLVAAFVAALLSAGAVLALCAWLLVMLWDRFGYGMLAVLALACLAAAVLLLLWLRARLRAEPALLADTLRELQHDARALRGEPRER